MAETTNTIDRSDLDAVIYATFKMIKDDRKGYPDKYGRRVPGLPQPLTVLVLKDNPKLQEIFSYSKTPNSEFANFIFASVDSYASKKSFFDPNKALEVYNAMGLSYPPSIGQRNAPEYFKTLKENDLKNNLNKTKENINKVIGSTSYKEAFY